MSKNYYIIPLFVPQEGCPHKCVFCNQDRITGSKEDVTAQTVYDTVEEYLKTISNKDATIEISFFGGTFTGIREEKQRELLSVAKEYKDKGLINKIRMSTRPDYINDYILSYLQDYRVDIIELGVQSLVEDVLIGAGRGHSIKQVEDASKLIKEYGFTLGHQIMPGLPKDSFEKDIKTVEKSISMKPDICRIYPSLVIKDTPMAIMYNRGEYVPYTLDEAVFICKKLYKMYLDAGVNVIRIGLQPTDTITEGKDIIDGPFHPAFRELVEGSLISDNIREAFKESKKGIVCLNSRDLSKLYANKKKYFKELLSDGFKIDVKIDDSLERGTIIFK